MLKCGSCIHSDFGGGSGWIKWCEVKKDYIHLMAKECHCSSYLSAWSKNLFGETLYHEMIERGLIRDATGCFDTEDYRPCMVNHRNCSNKKINELLKTCF